MAYTELSRLKRFATTAKRRGLRVDAAHTSERSAEEAPPFLCPVCEDGSIVQEICPRCEVEMRPTVGTLILREASTRARPMTGRSAMMFGLGLVGVVGAPASLVVQGWARGGESFDSAFLMLAAAALVIVPASLLALVEPWSRVTAMWRARASHRQAAARAKRAASFDGSTGEDRSFRARVQLDGCNVTFVGSDERVRLRMGSGVRVLGDDGERNVIGDGEDVEVVGAVQRHDGDLVFDGAQPLEVWVR